MRRADAAPSATPSYSAGTATFEFDADGVCAADQLPSWEDFSYQSTTPGNSSITFIVATGTRDSSGNITNLTSDVPLQFTKTSLSGDHACAAAWTSGPADACGYSEDTEIMGPQFGALRSGDILVDTTLQANSLSRNLNYLRIKATLNPSSDGTQTPKISNWDLQNLLRDVPMTRVLMENLPALLASTLLAVAACSGGNAHAPLVAVGAGGSNADASTGSSGGSGAVIGSAGGGSNIGGSGTNGGDENAGGTDQNAGGAGENSGGTGQNAGGTDQNAGGTAGSDGTGATGAATGGAGGAGEGAGGQATVPECTISSGVAGCDSCVQRHCNTPCYTCQTDSECNAIIQCIFGTCLDDQGAMDQTCAGQVRERAPGRQAGLQ